MKTTETPEARRILKVARGLKSEDGENPEYDRALVEMTCDLLGIPMVDRREVEQLIGIVR